MKKICYYSCVILSVFVSSVYSMEQRPILPIPYQRGYILPTPPPSARLYSPAPQQYSHKSILQRRKTKATQTVVYADDLACLDESHLKKVEAENVVLKAWIKHLVAKGFKYVYDIEHYRRDELSAAERLIAMHVIARHYKKTLEAYDMRG